MWLCQIINISSELGCSFSWTLCFGNDVADALAKGGARHMVSFVEDLIPLRILIRSYFL